jgi:site-specific DNA-methyltransferase (cytosine-N4-specific)
MREFPAESINMVMFSPPYWGLRNYGEKSVTIWGDTDCEHEWTKHVIPKERGSYGKNSWMRPSRNADAKWTHQISSFCVKCRAWKGQLGLEPTWQMYVNHMVKVGGEIKRVLKKTGSMYVVMGDTYAGSHCGKGDKTLFQNYRRTKVAGNLYDKPSPQAKAIDYKPKCLMGIPWRVAFALIEDGWILRNDIIWHKPNAMPSSVKDRLTQTYEHIFHFVKARRYYYDLDAIREPHKTAFAPFNLRVIALGKNPEDAVLTKHDLAVNRVGNFSYTDPLHVKPYNIKGKNPGDYWSICTKPFKGAHFAVYPEGICIRPIKSSCPPDGIVLDPMCGSGTTLVVAKKLGRKYIGIDINPKYVDIAIKRLLEIVPPNRSS